jgi:NhaA family Na+:H+ antiporter
MMGGRSLGLCPGFEVAMEAGETMAADGGTRTDVQASLVLLAVTAAALVIANSGLAGLYKITLATPVTIGLGAAAITDTLKDWIKNALMAVFFVYVGLEIKYEFARGALADRQRAILPFAGALGGMAAPAGIYLMIAGAPAFRAGWAIPSATDIAFAVGVVGLLGASVVPPALKAFLLAVAVIDDLGAILVIAVAYTSALHLTALIASAVVIAGLVMLNRAGVTALGAYLGVGLLLWVLVSLSGINPTLAGVVTALFVPLDDTAGGSPLQRLIDKLKSPVLFGIMPIFAFANAGVPLGGLALADLSHPVTAGIALGLLVGKPIGIAFAVLAATTSGLARLPEGATWPQIVGIACLAGIGFTMSLFIGALAFADGATMDKVRLGVLIGSTLSALSGTALLLAAPRFGSRPAV